MTTKYSEVYDLFLTKVTDWKLEKLYEVSPEDFETVLHSYMVVALPKFKNCNQSLSRNDLTDSFTETLTEDNKITIASIMVESWLEKEVNDIRQMALHIQDKDFKTYAEANNLKEKSFHWSRIKEQNSQMLVDYSLDNNDLWKDWLSGNFYTP